MWRIDVIVVVVVVVVVVVSSVKPWHDSFLTPFSPIFSPLLSLTPSPSHFSWLLHRGHEWIIRNVGRTIAASLGSPFHCSVCCSADSWHETARHTTRYIRAWLGDKKAKNREKGERKKEGRGKCFRATKWEWGGRGGGEGEGRMGASFVWAENALGSVWKGFMTIRWSPMPSVCSKLHG